MHRTLLHILLALLPLVPACGGTVSDGEPEIGSIDQAVRSRALVPGYYEGDSWDFVEHELTTLSLTKAGSIPGVTTDNFWARRCDQTPCTAAVSIEGNWSLTRRGSSRYLRFDDATGAYITKYAYQTRGATLWLREVNTRHWFAMDLVSETLCDDGHGAWSDDDLAGPGVNCLCPTDSHWSRIGCVDASGQLVPLPPPPPPPPPKMPLP